MHSTPEPIAIIGISCRFSGGASSLAKLWELIASRKDGWSPIPPERFDGSAFYHPDQQKYGRVFDHISMHYSSLHSTNFLLDSIMFVARILLVTMSRRSTRSFSISQPRRQR